MKDKLSQDTIDIIEQATKDHEDGNISFEEMKRIIFADLRQRQQVLIDEYKKATGEDLEKKAMS